MRISTSLPDDTWREVADAARAFEELGFDELPPTRSDTIYLRL